MPAGRDVGRIVALAVGYLALTVWLTWPLATSLELKLPCTQAACPFDTVYSAWVVSWVSHALTTPGLHVADANIYHPARDALYYGPAGFGAVPYALPTFLLTGNAAAAINVALFSCVVLSALALHWVVWRWTGSMAAGFVAAWTLLMNRWFLWGFVATTPHLAAIQYLPLIAFLAARPLGSWRQGVPLLLLIVLQCLTDPVYIATAVLAPLGTLGLARFARPNSRPAGWRLLAVLAASLVCLLPFLIGYARVRSANSSLGSLWPNPSKEAFAANPIDLTKVFWQGPEPTTTTLPLLALIVLGALVGGVRRWQGTGSGFGTGWSHAALWALAGTWMSLAPVVSLGGGGPHVHLPQYVLAATGFYEVVRVPSRLGVSGMIGLCLLAGVAFAELVSALAALRGRGRSSGALAAALAVGIAILAYRVPPVRAAPLPPIYPLLEAPATDPELLARLRAGDGPVLELPAFKNDRANPRWNVVPMYRSTLHWRPLVNGYSSYWPVGFYERMRLTPLLPVTSALRRLVCETGVRTIVVDLFNSFDARAVWLQARAHPPKGLRLVAAVRQFLLFDVTIPPPGEPGAPPCEAFGAAEGAARNHGSPHPGSGLRAEARLGGASSSSDSSATAWCSR